MGWRQGSRALLQVIISKLFQQGGAGGCKWEKLTINPFLLIPYVPIWICCWFRECILESVVDLSETHLLCTRRTYPTPQTFPVQHFLQSWHFWSLFRIIHFLLYLRWRSCQHQLVEKNTTRPQGTLSKHCCSKPNTNWFDRLQHNFLWCKVGNCYF